MLDSGLRAVLESWKRQLFRDIEGLIDSRLKTFAGTIVKGGKVDASQVVGTFPVATQQTVDHGNLVGLADDDHTNLLNEARHDLVARHGAAVLGTGTPDGTKFLRDDGTWQTVPMSTLDHDHSGDAGDGGTFDAANLTSGATPDGHVLTADGSGGAAWEASTGGSLTVTEIDAAPSVAGVTEIRVTNGTLTDVGAGVVQLDFGSAATDGSAIHDNVADEISAITEKASPVSADLLLIEDSADSNNKKRVQIGNLPGGGVDILEVQVFS